MTVSVTIATTPDDRAACLAIRHSVFVSEQGVPEELEWDDHDDSATHFLARDADGRPIGTARLLAYKGAAKIGRVAVLPEARGRSIGRLLMQATLAEARRQGFPTALLDAQVQVIAFYESLGFTAEGEQFDDAGIPHRRMRLPL